MGKISNSNNGESEVECLEETGVVTDILLTSDSYQDGVEGSGADESKFSEETGDGVGGSGADNGVETGCGAGVSGADESKFSEETGHGVGGSCALWNSVKRLDVE